jgi:hypothetical protein
VRLRLAAATVCPFEPRHVSTRDYFHPSLEGQRILAEVAWNAGPLPGL